MTNHTPEARSDTAEQYLLGRMSADDREQYEAHFFSCEECAEEVRVTAAFLDNLRHVTVSDAPAVASGVDARPANPAPSWWSRVMMPLFWPVPAGAAALLVLSVGLTGYLSVIAIPQVGRDGDATPRIQAAPWYFLSASRDNELPVVTATDRERWVGLTLSRSFARSAALYRCEVRDAKGAVVLTDVVSGPRAGDELQILLPTTTLVPGVYTVAVAGVDSASSQPPQSEYVLYRFSFQRGQPSTLNDTPNQP